MSAFDDQMDRRFREMIKAEFGDVAGTRAPDDPAPTFAPPATQPARQGLFRRKLPDPIEYFNLGEAIDRVDPAELESWHPPEPEPIGRPRGKVIVAILCLVIALLMGVISAAGINLPGGLAIIGVLVFAAGLALLLWSIPRRWPGDEEPCDW